MAMTLRIVIPPHPLIGHWLSILRSIGTPAPIYATGFSQIGKWLSYEALRDWLPNSKTEITSTNGITEGTIIESSIQIHVITNTPGGLELWLGAREILPNANLCFGSPPTEIQNNSGVIIYVDQITNGESLSITLCKLKEQKVNAERIRIITVIASSKGLKKIGEDFPDLTIYSACIDEELTENNEIKPGIGNPTTRLNTRITHQH